MTLASTRRTMHEEATGNHWEKTSHAIPGGGQGVLDMPDPQEARNLTADGYEVLREVVEMFGGQKKLAVWLGRGLDYNSKINEGLTRSGDRRAQFDWLVPLLRHPHAALRLLDWMCNVAGCEPPIPLVKLRPEQKARILASELTPERRRRLEREHGLPAGSLEP